MVRDVKLLKRISQPAERALRWAGPGRAEPRPQFVAGGGGSCSYYGGKTSAYCREPPDNRAVTLSEGTVISRAAEAPCARRPPLRPAAVGFPAAIDLFAVNVTLLS